MMQAQRIEIEVNVVQRRRARETGTVVLVIDNRDRSFDDSEDPWFTLCDDHGNFVSHATRRLAVWHAPNPLGWCETCMDAERREVSDRG